MAPQLPRTAKLEARGNAANEAEEESAVCGAAEAAFETNNDEKSDDTALKVSEEDKTEEKVDDAK
jgi:hypothetical protein